LLEKKQEVITLADEINKIKKEEIQEEQALRQEPPVPLLLTPKVEQEIQIFGDEIPVLKPLKTKLKLSKKNKVKHENRICIKCGEELEKEHVCKEKKKELEVVIMTDDIPFRNQNHLKHRI
jgi:hypothetical protein